MKWQHLRAIIWVRWRMSLRQLRRAGLVSTVILAFCGVLLAAASIGLFFLGMLGGIAVLPKMSPEKVMLVWDVGAAVLLFFWTAGLVAELQRSEVLSLQKLLYLPVSLSGTFIINYLGSLASLTLAMLLPGMVGLSIALVIVKGPTALLIFPLLGGFVLMVTAVTYQIQGWLATLMLNKRRRRTVIAVVTFSFILLSQLPNLLGNVLWRGSGRHGTLRAAQGQTHDRRRPAPGAGEITADEYERQDAAAQHEYEQKAREARRARQAQAMRVLESVNLALPVGWLPYGAMGCARGEALSAMLAALGMGLIGGLSLWRSYRTTLRLYSGHYTSGTARHAPLSVPAKPALVGTGFLERDIPGLSEHAATVALANLRSLARAPEAKMILLTPVILVLAFGTALLARRGMSPPEVLRPFMGLAAIGMALLSMQQLVANQFGLDRGGFRAYLLSSSSRRDILLGKNVSFAAVALGVGIPLLAVVQALYPMHIDHLLATLMEMGSIYLVFCMVANLTSILAPVPLASGSLRPAHPKASVVLVQFLLVLLLPILIGLAVLPLGIEVVCHYFGWLTGVPIYLICALPELGVVAWLYGRAVRWQGRMLHAREQRILEVVTTKVE